MSKGIPARCWSCAPFACCGFSCRHFCNGTGLTPTRFFCCSLTHPSKEDSLSDGFVPPPSIHAINVYFVRCLELSPSHVTKFLQTPLHKVTSPFTPRSLKQFRSCFPTLLNRWIGERSQSDKDKEKGKFRLPPFTSRTQKSTKQKTAVTATF